jgi:predicted ester cyclase
VAVRGTIRGTHEGEWMGLAPTHKTVTFAIMRIYRIADGKIAEQWTVWDEMSLMQQLGAIPAPG